jgi:hypothetical protein
MIETPAADQVATSGLTIAGNDILIELPDALRQAINKTKQAKDDFTYVEEAMKDIQQHKTPKPHDAGWKSLVKYLTKLESDIKKSDFISRFDSKNYPVTVGEFLACTTRASALSKIDGYLAVLTAGVQQGQELDDQFRDALTANEATQSILGEVMKLYEKLAGLPEIGEFFTWHWYDLNVHVRPALHSVHGVLMQRRKRLDAEREEIRIWQDNLSGNRAALNNVECDLSGDYGKYNNGAEDGNGHFRLTRSGGVYSCTPLSPATCPCKIASASSISKIFLE